MRQFSANFTNNLKKAANYRLTFQCDRFSLDLCVETRATKTQFDGESLPYYYYRFLMENCAFCCFLSFTNKTYLLFIVPNANNNKIKYVFLILM